MTEAEIDAQIELLVQSGTVAEADRDKVAKVLHARRSLGGVKFGPAGNGLDEAFARLREAIAAIHRQQAEWAALFESIKPLADDRRCHAVFSRLYPMSEEFSAICASLTMPMDSPGPAIARLEAELADLVRELQKVVGTGARGRGGPDRQA